MHPRERDERRFETERESRSWAGRTGDRYREGGPREEWGEDNPYDYRYEDEREEMDPRARQRRSYDEGREYRGYEGSARRYQPVGGYGYGRGGGGYTGSGAYSTAEGRYPRYRSGGYTSEGDVGDAWPGAQRSRAPGSAYGQFSGRGPKGYQRSRERILDDVCERLTDDPELDASGIEVDVQQDVVVLRGTVYDRQQKRIAEDIAESVPGIRDVRNELDVEKGMLQTLTDAITGRSDEGVQDVSTPPTKAREKSRIS